MTQPFSNEPGTNPPRYPEPRPYTNYYVVGVGIAAALVLAVIAVLSHGGTTPENPASVVRTPSLIPGAPSGPETTGQSDPARAMIAPSWVARDDPFRVRGLTVEAIRASGSFHEYICRATGIGRAACGGGQGCCGATNEACSSASEESTRRG